MKIQLSNLVLRSFFDQLRFVSQEQEKKVVESAESLMMLVDPAKDYPYEFVVFRLTGTRPRLESFGQTIPGRQLLDDLRVWLTSMTSKITVSVNQISEDVFSVDQIARRCNVSAKTIRRWQKRGLVGRIYLFADGKKRLGFTASAFEQFQDAHAELLSQANDFRLLSAIEKQGIVDAFCELARHNQGWTRNQIILRLIYQTGRAKETIRYVLSDYEQSHPDKPLPIASRGKMTSKEISQMYKLYRHGASVGDLASRFKRTRAAIHRGILRSWAAELHARKINYIPSLEFESKDAEKTILDSELNLSPAQIKGGSLSRPQEQTLFCRFNYLKFLADTLRQRIAAGPAQIRILKRIESLLSEAEQIRRFLVESNMPLVVGIAGKHMAAGLVMSELVGEGTVSMMRAVEKFDYTRGYRFSTYASWIIAKDFARKIPGRPDHITGSDFSEIGDQMQPELLADSNVLEKASSDLRQVIDNTLDERERYVVLNHFAIDSSVIKKKPKTLKQIGDELGLTKERVRQIELQALQKLRHSLSPEQFELFTR